MHECYILSVIETPEDAVYFNFAIEKEVNGVLPTGSNVKEAYVCEEYLDADDELIYLSKEQVDNLTFGTEDGSKYILNNKSNRKKLGLKYKEEFLQRTTGLRVKEDYVLQLDQYMLDHVGLPFLNENDTTTWNLEGAGIQEKIKNDDSIYINKEKVERLATTFPDGSRLLLNTAANLEELGLAYRSGRLCVIEDDPKEEEEEPGEEEAKEAEPKEEPKEQGVSWIGIAFKAVALGLELKKALEEKKPKPAANSNGLNALADEIHQVNRNKGFWDQKRNVGEMLMLVTSELGEGMEALRKKKFADMIRYHEALRTGKNPQEAFEQYIKDSFEDELADAVIRLLDMATGLHINIERHIRLKLEYNRSRERFHGKAF